MWISNTKPTSIYDIQLHHINYIIFSESINTEADVEFAVRRISQIQ